MKILFATSNERKIKEARAACDQFGIEIEPIKLDIVEIQATDPRFISEDKIFKAFETTQKPVVVTDTFWNIPALKGFPGGYMKDVANWLDSEDFLNLIRNKKDKRVAFTESVHYKDAVQNKTFSREFWGMFASEPKGTGNSIEKIAQFNGFTIGERRDQGKLSHDPEDYVWFDFAKWFVSKKDSK